MAFSRTWNASYEASPADTDQAKQGALRIREIKQDVRERAEVDHFWQDSTHGGKHKQVRMRELVSDPANAADEGVLYVKDDGGGRTELYYIDSAGVITKITTNGEIISTPPDGSITTAKIVDNAVTAAKIDSNAVGQSEIAASAVGQMELKTTTGDNSASSGGGTNNSAVTLPGGTYGFWPQSRMVAGVGLTGSFIARPGRPSVTNTDTGYATVVMFSVSLISGLGVVTGYTRQRYIQASPPYEPYRIGDPVPLFIFARIDKTTGKVIATYVAEDPPWANNGPTVINPLGRIQALARARLPKTQTLEEEFEAWADLDAWMRDPANVPIIKQELARKITQEEKNRDMMLFPHPFPDIDPAKEQAVVLSPTNCRLTCALRARLIYGGDSISEMLHGGFFTIDNTPMPGLNTPFNVMAVNCRLKNTARR